MSTRAIRRHAKKQVSKAQKSSNIGSDGFEKPIEGVKPRFIQIKFRALMDKVREVWSTQIDASVHTFIEPERIRKILSYSEDDFADKHIDESEEKALYYVLYRIENYEELIEYFTSGDSKIAWMGSHGDVLYVLTVKKPPYSWKAVLTLYSIPIEMNVETLS